jgi:hypothetical protein
VPPLLQFIIRSFLIVPASLVVIMMALYGRVILTPSGAPAQSYLSARMDSKLTDGQLAVMTFGIAWNMFGDGLGDVLDPRAL